MRFNNKELAFLAKQDSSNFEREGILYMKEKSSRLLKKKDEAFVEKFFRLRGNLLFYFKGKDAKSDVQGLFVMERCSVELDLNEQQNFSFVIVFEGDEVTYTFSAKTEDDRDSWIQALHVAGYENLKMQLQSLREQVQAKTGQDPLAYIRPTDTGMDFETQAAGSSEDPAMEISMSIEGLPSDSSGLPPNPFVVIYTIVPPQQQTWMQHNHTEMVEKNNDPHFLKTVGFGDANGLEPTTRVKVTVYHVKERMTGTMTQIGQVIFTINDLLMKDDMTLHLTLIGMESRKVGSLKIVGWLNDAAGCVTDWQNNSDVFENSSKRGQSQSFKRRSKRLDTLKPLCENITTRTFRFETNDSVKLLVYEYMAESKYTFEIPIKALKVFIEEEKLRIKQLNELGKLPGQWENACQECKDISMSIETTYSQHVKHLSTYKGSSFKPSSKKSDKELEFVPINLHLQRMTVLNEATEKCGCYDIFTVGAFAAHTRKFKAGGLSRLLHQLQERYSPEGTLSKVTKVKRACELLNRLYRLEEEILILCDRVCQQALKGDGDSLMKATSELAEKVKDLVQDCESSILQDTAKQLADIHEELEAQLEEQQRLRPGEKSPETDWKWTGSCFVKSPTVEPWDMTRVNTEAALVCLTSMVEDIIQNKSGTMDRPKWLGDISPVVMKLKSFVEIVCKKATHFMAFLDLLEHRENLKLMHTIKYRRDICFTQALTTFVTSLIVHINSLINKTAILDQIAHLGVLVQVEGLLSCYGEEVGMLEDTVVAVDDLSSVTFRLIQETAQRSSIELTLRSFTKAGLYPDLNRHHICIEIPLKKSSFEKLPQRLRSGLEVKVIPVFFNVGINEQATLAEKFGSTELQDKTNEVSLGRLHHYIEELDRVSSIKVSEKTGAGTVSDLMQQLRYNVYSKKSKNVEILHLAAELCRKLHGIRVTCCKSAKDRTAMSVTLEQVQILQREHNLASHVFAHSLDCFRSEGVRRENAFKNIGQRKYAFNSLQLLSFPKQYRPPNGTYGNVQN